MSESEEYECERCGKTFKLENGETPYGKDHTNGDWNCLCDDCMDEKRCDYNFICGICQDWHDNPTKPEENFFVLTPAMIEEFDMECKPGIYQVLEYPFHYGDIVFGFSGIEYDSVKLLREIDVLAVMKKINKLNHGSSKYTCIDCPEICQDCAEKYVGKDLFKYNHNQYSSEKRLDWNINTRGLIQKGSL